MTTDQAEGVVPASTHVLAPWCTTDDIPPRRLEDSNGDPIGDVQLDWMIGASTELLFHLSGRKYRSGRSRVRPTVLHRSAGSAWQTYPWSSAPGWGAGWEIPAGWAWTSVGPGYLEGEDLSELRLMSPVLEVHEVLLDGVALRPDQYAVRDRKRLALNQGAGAWPWEQDTSVPPDRPGTALLDYSWGSTPGPAGRLAAAELTVELALSFSGQDACKLPARVQTVATQGTNVAVGDALEFLKEDLSGLPICDMFLRAVNPAKRRKRSVFLAPNSPQLRHL